MLAASFVNNSGTRRVYLNSHSEIALLENIKAELLEYDWSMGWNSSTSIENNNTNDTIDENGTTNGSFTNDIQCDLGILYERCEANGIDNIVFKSKRGSRTYYSIPGLNHIDLYQVYSKVMVQDTIYNRSYRTHKLDGNNKGQGKGKGKLRTMKEEYNALGKLSSEAQARLKRVKEIMAEKSKFINTEEFAGAGKIIDVRDMEPDATSKYGPVVQFAIREPKTNRERLWSCGSVRALRVVIPLYEAGKRMMHVWTTGTGKDKLYYAEAVSGGAATGSSTSSKAKKRKGTAQKRK